MISIQYESRILKITSASASIPRVLQLGLWRIGFVRGEENDSFLLEVSDPAQVLQEVIQNLTRRQIEYQLCENLECVWNTRRQIQTQLRKANANGNRFKESSGNLSAMHNEFIEFLTSMPRTLKEHQIKSAIHSLEVGNAANFSVPGSGKTTVVLVIYEWLRRNDLVDAIFVVGPTSCFEPWKQEFPVVIGRQVKSVILAGGSPTLRNDAYLGRRGIHDFELYLTSFQTLQNDYDKVDRFFNRLDQRVLLVIDEAHYIKRQGGAWANAALAIANSAGARCILTGTPFPKSLTDAFNLFEFLWPGAEVFDEDTANRIVHCIKTNESELARDLINHAVSGLFYRVRKRDLGLAEQIFHPPIRCEMNPIEREVYFAIIDRIAALELYQTTSDTEILAGLRRGRIMRLRQCVSNVALLATVIEDYAEQLIDVDSSLASLIENYDDTELPGKFTQLDVIVDGVVDAGGKVLIWSNFIGTINKINHHFKQKGQECKKIYGATPFESDESSSCIGEESREEIVRQFNDKESGVNILIANPAACAEAISLHKACSVAVYYDLSYNCAHFMQSQDRIHRVGGSEDKVSEYYFLQYPDTIDEQILENLNRKQRAMAAIIDQDYPVYDLDMFLDTHLEDLEIYNATFINGTDI